VRRMILLVHTVRNAHGLFVVHTVRNFRMVTYRMHRSVQDAQGLKSRAPTALQITMILQLNDSNYKLKKYRAAAPPFDLVASSGRRGGEVDYDTIKIVQAV